VFWEVLFVQRIIEIPLVLLDDFPSFPFRLRRDSEFLNLLDSISTYGVLQPVIVRPVAERYQLISGHRRKRACEILRYDSVFGIVLDNLDDSEAMLLMLELNLRQRRNLLPSEKAFAYKMRYAAVNQSPEKPKNGGRRPVPQRLYLQLKFSFKLYRSKKYLR
jgi:ParB family chromosome partitioning protein